MKNKRWLLLKTLFASTNRLRILKREHDKRKRNNIKGGIAGVTILYVILVAYCVLNSIGMGSMGFSDVIPQFTASLVSLMVFFLTIFKTNGYLFAFKEYDMLMAMPFSVKTIVEDKFLYMYVQNLPWSLSISIAMYVGYAVYGTGGVLGGIYWIILSFFIPLVPMLAAAAVGTLIAGAGSGVRNKKIVQIVLTFIVVIPLIFSRFIIEKIFKENKLETVFSGVGNALERAGKVYVPVRWFSDAVSKHSLSSALLLVGVSVLLFEAVFLLVAKFYRQINSGLMTSSAKRRYKVNSLKKRSMVKSVAYKEFKRMTGSTIYATNVAMGEILAFILGVAAFFVKGEDLLLKLSAGTYIDPQIVFPAIPLVSSMIVGTMSSTVCSPSLEGKNYWIVQCMPVSKPELYKGKMLFNMLLETPFGLFCTIALCFSFKIGMINSIICVAITLLMCFVSTYYGLFCGIKHINQDWNNEVEVIKQGTAVVLYIFPVMFGTILWGGGMVALGTVMNATYVLVINLAVATVLTVLSRFAAYSQIEKGEKL